MITKRFENQKSFIDDAGDLISHCLAAVAGTSEKSVASVILLLSAIPEYRGMMDATGDRLVSLTAAAVSLVVIKLALRERSTAVKLPGGIKLAIRWFAILYALQLGSGLAFIIHAGNYIDVALIAISAVGAICSERIASVIKAERSTAQNIDFGHEKRRIQLAELQAKSNARVAAAQAKAAAATQQPTIVPNVEPSATPIIDANLATAGRNAALNARQRAAQKRQNALCELLQAEYSGQPTGNLPKSTLAKQFGVTATTISRDLEALQSKNRINGVV